MSQVLSLCKFFHRQVSDSFQKSPLEQVLEAYISGKPVARELLLQAIDYDQDKVVITPWDLIEKWRITVALLLIAKDQELLTGSTLESFTQRIKPLKRFALWKEFQLLTAYQSLAAVLIGQQVELPLYQLPNGACLLEAGGHWTWGEVPHPCFHAELGALWILFGIYAGNQKVLDAALGLAEWHKNTLDYHFIPFIGLFSHEGDAAEVKLLISNSLLFATVGKVFDKPEMVYIAEKQMERLLLFEQEEQIIVSPIFSVIEFWMEKHLPALSSKSCILTDSFQDPFLAMAGCRSAETSAVATLFGGRSGLGCFTHEDVRVVNFGPQHLPLDDCRGFGLEGGMRLLSGKSRTITATEDEFLVQGIGRIATRPKLTDSLARYREGDQSGYWLEACLEYQKGVLSIQAQFQRVLEPISMAFTFFVKAKECVISGKKTIKPRSFQQYWGEVCSMEIGGETGRICLDAEQKNGEMHVIPLGGGENFWGADFLIAYQCPMEEISYKWTLTPLGTYG